MMMTMIPCVHNGANKNELRQNAKSQNYFWCLSACCCKIGFFTKLFSPPPYFIIIFRSELMWFMQFCSNFCSTSRQTSPKHQQYNRHFFLIRSFLLFLLIFILYRNNGHIGGRLRQQTNSLNTTIKFGTLYMWTFSLRSLNFSILSQYCQRC